MIPDEFCNLFFPILVDKDKGVVTRVASVIFVPSFSRMDDFLIVTDGDV